MYNMHSLLQFINTLQASSIKITYREPSLFKCKLLYDPVCPSVTSHPLNHSVWPYVTDTTFRFVFSLSPLCQLLRSYGKFVLVNGWIILSSIEYVFALYRSSLLYEPSYLFDWFPKLYFFFFINLQNLKTTQLLF